MNADDAVNASDALLILQMSVRLIDSFPAFEHASSNSEPTSSISIPDVSSSPVSSVISKPDDVSSVIAQIDSLPAMITLENKATVTAARVAYDALTAEQKTLVTNLDKLTVAEHAIAQLETDKAAADSVIVQINSLPATVTLENKADIVAVRTAYDALTAVQKQLVGNLDKLTAAESTIAQLEADQAAADAVAKQIESLPEASEITVENEEAVGAVVAAYDTLTDAQKAFMSEALTTKLNELRTVLDKSYRCRKIPRLKISVIQRSNHPITIITSS